MKFGRLRLAEYWSGTRSPMPKPYPKSCLDLSSLLTAYRHRATTPAEVITQIYAQIEAYAEPAMWIYLAPLATSLERARYISQLPPESLPLYGIPFAIKDNIDWAGVPTTAGCPEYAYVPEDSATVVKKLCGAGAILIGKTNLDQFATGLVGTRSPYGVCRNPFNPAYIPGGSSSGSAVAVAAGMVSFALGTDTAGSGRVPAAFTNIVGLKPSRGALSTLGVVPAVRSLDCVSIFALTCTDAAAVLAIAAGYDSADPFSRQVSQQKSPHLQGLRVGVPQSEYLYFFDNAAAQQNYHQGLAQLQALGGELITIDFQPFAETAALLYEGAWLAERTAAVGAFLEQDHVGINPVVKQIILGGKQISAVTACQDAYRLKTLQRQAEHQWQGIDILALPTTGTIYTIAEVAASPFMLNRNLGTYTNFVNLLDLSAIAVPNGFQTNGLPTGITFMALAGYDQFLCELGHLFHTQQPVKLGATEFTLG
jgi:allophanate hydrolase